MFYTKWFGALRVNLLVHEAASGADVKAAPVLKGLMIVIIRVSCRGGGGSHVTLRDPERHIYDSTVSSHHINPWTARDAHARTCFNETKQYKFQIITITPARRLCFGRVCLLVCLFVCLFVCLSVCPQNYLQSNKWICMELLPEVCLGPTQQTQNICITFVQMLYKCFVFTAWERTIHYILGVILIVIARRRLSVSDW